MERPGDKRSLGLQRGEPGHVELNTGKIRPLPKASPGATPDRRGGRGLTTPSGVGLARPAVVTERLSLTRQGNIRVALKTPYRDGTTHVVFQPLDFIASLAALVPRPRVNVTRFHGVFAPNSRYRAQITPAGRGRRRPADSNQPGPEQRQAMTWAQRLKRVFRIDIDQSAGRPIGTVVNCREAVGHRDVPDETCEYCGGGVRVIACIEDPVVIEKILNHLEHREAAGASPHPPRAPPATSGGDSP